MLLDDTIITSIVGIFTVPASKGRRLQIENRPFYALSFCLDDGKIIYEQEGKRFVSEKGTAVILPKGASYTLYNEEGGNFPIINFITAKPLCSEFEVIRLKRPEAYLRDYETIRKLWHMPSNRAQVYSLLYGMISRLSSETSPKHPALATAMEYILANIGDPSLSNEKLADIARVSEVYFRRLFKESYGITPKQFILNLRIDEAKRLLAEGLTSISTVAEACGFSGIYHFSRIFKTVTGMSPSEYIKRGK